MTTVDFTALLLGALGHTEGEFTSLLYFNAGDDTPHAEVMEPADAVAAAAKLPRNADCYFGVNPVAGPTRKNAGKGTEADVTRLAALFCDIDVKPGACPSVDVAQAIVAELGILVGTCPSTIVYSGGGVHPYWPVLDGHDTKAARVILKRWGRLVAAVAEKFGVAVDNVFNLDRVLRLPGTFNHKTGTPRPVIAEEVNGGPLELAEVAERLDEVGIFEIPEDTTEADHTEVSTPSEWQWAHRTCAYVTTMVDGFRTDSPKMGAGRSPWLISCKVRLNCAKRLGCITEADYQRAVTNLEERFAEVVADPAFDAPRRVKKYEHRDTMRHGVKRAAAKSDDDCRAELGGHSHDSDRVIEADPADLGGDGAGDNSDGVVFTFIDGGAFIFDQPDIIPAVWGRGSAVLWAEGESLMIAGPMGLGKTTLAGQLVRARLGLGHREVLGLPVADTGGIVLYLAMDRPRQIARSLQRQFRGDHRQVASARLKVWEGPPPADIAQNPALLLTLALAAGADTVVVDSLKDAAVGLTNDEVGAGYNRARQHLIAAGIELLELHHTVKRGATGGAPTAAADVYGSAWLSNGTGSIIMLAGDPGDPIVGFRHIRQPAEEVGPWQVCHNQIEGRLTISDAFDVVAFVADCGPDGATATGLADAQNAHEGFDSDRARRSAIEKARRQLERLAEGGSLVRVEGQRGGGSDRAPTAYFVAYDPEESNHAQSRENLKPQVEQSRAKAITKAITQQSRQSRETAKPQVEQSREQSRSSPAKPITQPTVPVGDRGARGGRSKADRTCVHCGGQTVAGQRDSDGRPAHLGCTAERSGGDAA